MDGWITGMGIYAGLVIGVVLCTSHNSVSCSFDL